MEDIELYDELDKWVSKERLTVIVGHFGTGKTELSVNMAVSLGRQSLPFSFADLDIVDPYFRSRERADMITRAGGRLITSSKECMDADIPSIPSDVAALFDEHDRYGILDIGGDPSGARVLAQFRSRIAREHARVVCVLNFARPLMKTVQEAEHYIRMIEMSSGIKVTELINNTHLCNETQAEDIISGAAAALETSSITGIPLSAHTVIRQLIPEVRDAALGEAFIWPLDIYMKRCYPYQKMR